MPARRRDIAILSVLVPLLAACSTRATTTETAPEASVAPTEVAAAPTVDEESGPTPILTPLPGPETVQLGPGAVTTESGLRYEDLAVGDGAQAKACDLVTFEFTTSLTDGTVVESTDVYGVPWTVVHGTEPSHLVRGWDEALDGMRVGGSRRAVVPAQLAFGEAGTGAIPPNAALVIDLELLDIAAPPELDQVMPEIESFERTPSGLEYVVLQEGEGKTAAEHDLAFVHYVGWLEDGTRFDSTEGDFGCGPVPFPVGGAIVIKAWDEAVLGMKPGGRKLLRVPPELGHGEQGSGAIPPNATLLYDLYLAGVQEPPTNVDQPGD